MDISTGELESSVINWRYALIMPSITIMYLALKGDYNSSDSQVDCSLAGPSPLP